MDSGSGHQAGGSSPTQLGISGAKSSSKPVSGYNSDPFEREIVMFLRNKSLWIDKVLTFVGKNRESKDALKFCDAHREGIKKFAQEIEGADVATFADIQHACASLYLLKEYEQELKNKQEAENLAIDITTKHKSVFDETTNTRASTRREADAAFSAHRILGVFPPKVMSEPTVTMPEQSGELTQPTEDDKTGHRNGDNEAADKMDNNKLATEKKEQLPETKVTQNVEVCGVGLPDYDKKKPEKWYTFFLTARGLLSCSFALTVATLAVYYGRAHIKKDGEKTA